jgi:hypothetical protein
MLSGPAASWAEKLPQGIPKLHERLSFLRRPMAAVQTFINRAEGLAPGAEAKPLPVKVEGTGLSERLLNGTRNVVSGLLETVLVLFFLLISVIRSCAGWWKFCPGSRTSARRLTSRTRSKATSPPIW